jgi:hypothetical protein
MKLSQFGVNKKIRFNNGEVEVITNELNGEINFYNLTYDRIEAINNNVVQKLTGKEKEEELTYKIIPYVCDLEIDESLDYFINLTKVPPLAFTYFIESIVDIVNNLFDASERLPGLESKTEKLNSRIPVLEETKEQKLERLYNELSNVGNDKERRKALFREISELEAGE